MTDRWFPPPDEGLRDPERIAASDEYGQQQRVVPSRKQARPSAGEQAGAEQADAEQADAEQADAEQADSPVPTDSPEGSPIVGPGEGRGVLAGLVRILGLSVLLVVASAAVAGLAVVVIMKHYESGLPDVDQLQGGYRPPQVTHVLARDGTALATLFTERRTVIAVGDLPAHVKLSFLAAEDASFYEHQGLDYFGLLRAVIANLRAGKTAQGGSTITQQVVKNILLDSRRSYARKIREAILARRLEQSLTKDEILGLYLNQLYLGHGRFGVEEAARYYFGRRARELDLAESSLLAGIVAAPERFSPRRSPERALERRQFVLGQMLAKGFVTRDLYDEAARAPLRLAPAIEAESEIAPEVVDLAKLRLQEVVGADAASGGYSVTTSIDLGLEAEARKALRQGLDQYARRQKLHPPYTLTRRRLWGEPFVGHPRRNKIYVGRVVETHDDAKTLDVQVGDTVGRVLLVHEERYNPKHLAPSEFAHVGALMRVGVLGDPDGEVAPELRLELGPQGALVAIDPRTREVLALVGGYEALAGGLDRATDARRQPGSAFKPFVYGCALASRRFTPATMLEIAKESGPDAQIEAGAAVERISLRTALARSVNEAAEQVLQQVGAPNVVAWAHAAGIESNLQPTPSLALGAYEVRPLEIANAYATFASSGRFAPPVIVTKILGPSGAIVPQPPAQPPRVAMASEEAYLITSLMRSVVEQGTARRAKSLARPVAGKTGTTNDARDAWFVGFSTDVVAAVWVGYDDAIPLGSGEAGAVTALPIWIDFMQAAHRGKPAVQFPRPGSVIVERIDPATGLLARFGQEDAIDEEFLEGTVPTETATDPATLDGGAPDNGAELPPGDTQIAEPPATEPAAGTTPAPVSVPSGQAPAVPTPVPPAPVAPSPVPPPQAAAVAPPQPAVPSVPANVPPSAAPAPSPPAPAAPPAAPAASAPGQQGP
ncbi:MAG: PBP1A family penicillin-binding protein [Polyangiaceae bacterium]|nr:PBP1A family penicillin-binding protein [Polyangiaceae bacterium]